MVQLLTVLKISYFYVRLDQSHQSLNIKKTLSSQCQLYFDQIVKFVYKKYELSVGSESFLQLVPAAVRLGQMMIRIRADNSLSTCAG